MVRLLAVLALFTITITTKGQFVPNRSFEYGIDELDIEGWTKTGDKGVIRRVKYHLFQNDTIWPWSGEYMLLFENPLGHDHPNASINVIFPCSNFIVSRFYLVYNTYYADSMTDNISSILVREKFIDGDSERIDIRSKGIIPNNIWFNPKYNVWRYDKETLEYFEADTCSIILSFDSDRGFNSKSFALIDDLRIDAEPLSRFADFNKKSSNFYPNPFYNYGVFESQIAGKIAIFDFLGRQILEQDIESGSTKIFLDNAASGVYTIIFQDAMGRQTQHKVVKQ